MSTATASDERSRKASPFRTDHFLPRQHTGRERSPYLVTDRVTGYRSPCNDVGYNNDSSDAVSPPQAYSTSFSAVTSIPSHGRKQGYVSRAGVPTVSTLPRRSFRQSKVPQTGSSAHETSSHRTGSCDLLSSTDNSTQSSLMSYSNTMANKAASCDLLDSPGLGSSHLSGSPNSTSKPPYNTFENRRFGPKYSSTPARYRMNDVSPAAGMTSAGSYKHVDQRLESVVSSLTMESVFMPDSPGAKDLSLLDTTDHASLPHTDTAATDTTGVILVDKSMLCKQVFDVDYKISSTVTFAQLKKLRKKGLLPEPNAETDRLVQRMMEQAKSNPDDLASSESVDRSARGRWRDTIDKKANTIANFLRRFRSPRTAKKTLDRPNRRSKSAGRLEGNRVFESESSQGVCTAGEISYEGPSTSSDHSTSAFHSPTPSEQPLPCTDPTYHPQSNADSPPLWEQTPVSCESVTVEQSNKRNKPSSSARRILKSLEDNVGTDNSVYRSFKEKQSPGYRRRPDASAGMRAQALKVVDISLQSATKQTGM